MIFTQIKLTINEQIIEVPNTSDTRILWHFNTFSTIPTVEFISQKLIRVVAAFDASDLAF